MFVLVFKAFTFRSFLWEARPEWQVLHSNSILEDWLWICYSGEKFGSILWGFRFLLEVGNNETHRRPGRVSWWVKVMRFSADNFSHPHRQVTAGSGWIWEYVILPTRSSNIRQYAIQLFEVVWETRERESSSSRPRDRTFIHAVSGRTPRQVRTLKAQRSSWRIFSTLPCWSRKDDILIVSCRLAISILYSSIKIVVAVIILFCYAVQY